MPEKIVIVVVVIQPTRVTDRNSSLIDNIFGNNISDDTKR